MFSLMFVFFIACIVSDVTQKRRDDFFPNLTGLLHGNYDIKMTFSLVYPGARNYINQEMIYGAFKKVSDIRIGNSADFILVGPRPHST